jgi:hypothetical protein
MPAKFHTSEAAKALINNSHLEIRESLKATNPIARGQERSDLTSGFTYYRSPTPTASIADKRNRRIQRRKLFRYATQAPPLRHTYFSLSTFSFQSPVISSAVISYTFLRNNHA